VIDVNEDERTSSQWAVVIFLIMKFMMMCHCLTTINASFIGATENARHENTGRSKMQGWKMRDMNLRHQIARVENARHENAGPNCRGGKCGKS